MVAKSTQQWHQIARLIKHTYDVHGKSLPNEWHKIAAKRIYVTYIQKKSGGTKNGEPKQI